MEDLSSVHRARRKMALRRRNNDQNGGVIINKGRDDNNDHGHNFNVNVGLTWKLEESMVEMRELIKMSGLVLEGEIVQQLQEVNPKMYIGTRKVGEAQALLGLINKELERNGESLCCTVVFGAELTPGQQRRQRR
jgi:50S ribosomal subunit-associated GTPase HflX